jgi:hypothetical protein
VPYDVGKHSKYYLWKELLKERKYSGDEFLLNNHK